MLIAGEASGDLHASHLMAALARRDPEAVFTFIGGDLMAAQAGKEPAVHIRDMAYMGFSEVIRNLGAIRRNLATAKATLRNSRPDALVLVDYPSFNLKVAELAKKLGIPVYYYISPKVWAWKEHRVKKIKKLVGKMFCIFPFEVGFYRDRHGYEVEFVGNPSVDEVDRAMAKLPSRAEFLSRHRLRDRQLIALLPGSRMGEIRNNLKIMTAVVERFPQYRGVIAGAPNIAPEVYASMTDLPVVYGETLELLAHSRAALVTSGTATLEAALVGTPQVACYRSNGKKLSYEIMKRVLKVRYVTLPNLVADREVVAEMLLHLCTVDNVFEKLTPLLGETGARKTMLDGYGEIRRLLTAPGDAPANVAEAIVKNTEKSGQ